MDRNLIISQIEIACEYEEKFISQFDDFFTMHVTDNYHLSDAEKDFVNKRIKILFDESKIHLNTFNSMLKKIRQNKDIIL
ncbi:MAG: hypothetical protein Q7S34_01045 [bacterium]|nr:hypothetical protein [bacterium]